MHSPGEDDIGHYTLEDFQQALQRGQRPDGSAIDEQAMPWNLYSLLTDEEVEAIWLYLQSLEPLADNTAG